MADKTFAIFTDLSGVSEMSHGSGGFATKRAALERLVEMLEAQREDASVKLSRARGALRRTAA